MAIRYPRLGTHHPLVFLQLDKESPCSLFSLLLAPFLPIRIPHGTDGSIVLVGQVSRELAYISIIMDALMTC